MGPLFLCIERDAPFWQHIRSSEQVATYGDHAPLAEQNIAFDLRRLLEPFQLGFRNLREIWALLLPPGALLELNKAHRLPPEQFRIPDELWARIIYDFALAYRLRTIGRDHLLRAMTPLYLGWVASYALEVETSDAAAVQKRLERLCVAYENGKPYLLSRWRWPDRFNP
jgi:glucosylglycerate synthase